MLDRLCGVDPNRAKATVWLGNSRTTNAATDSERLPVGPGWITGVAAIAAREQHEQHDKTMQHLARWPLNYRPRISKLEVESLCN